MQTIEDAMKLAVKNYEETKTELDKFDLEPMERINLMMSLATLGMLSSQVTSMEMAKAWVSILATYSRQQLDLFGKCVEENEKEENETK